MTSTRCYLLRLQYVLLVKKTALAEVSMLNKIIAVTLSGQMTVSDSNPV